MSTAAARERPTSQAFRGIQYARAERFGPAEIVPLRDADPNAPRGPLSPQGPSRLASVLGPQADLEQSESCHVVSVFTPDTNGHRPVLVWFHGGAHVTGGGELPWYDGVRLAEEQDVVVVTVTYRLGVLGHYHPDDHTGPSPATTDQTTAIEWVHRHIQELGGDPNRITLVGQSAGASSIEVMLRWGLGPHVTGAILQSGNLCDPSISRSLVQAREHSASFDVLMKSVDPRGLPVSALLQYQDEFTRLNAGPTWAPARPDIEQPLDLALLGGWNTDDDLPFTVMSHNLDALTWHHRELLEAQAHADTASLYAEPTLEALGESYANGRPAWAYQFTWSAPGSPWGACHCIEIPFVLGAQYAWRHAPMLHGVPSDQLETYGRQMRQAWAEFARHANPGGEWRPWTPHEGAINLVPDLWGEV